MKFWFSILIPIITQRERILDFKIFKELTSWYPRNIFVTRLSASSERNANRLRGVGDKYLTKW
jgi:hypothetical protein